MRYIRYLFLALVAIALVTVSLANRQIITLKVLPQELADFAGWNSSIDLPLFLVLFAGIAVGLLVGFVWEWLREHKHRTAATQNRREKERLEREVEKMKTPEKGSADDVLAIIDGKRAAG